MLLGLDQVSAAAFLVLSRAWTGHCPEAANSDKGNGYSWVTQKNSALLAW